MKMKHAAGQQIQFNSDLTYSDDPNSYFMVWYANDQALDSEMWVKGKDASVVLSKRVVKASIANDNDDITERVVDLQRQNINTLAYEMLWDLSNWDVVKVWYE